MMLSELNSFHRRLGRPSLELKQKLKQACDYILGEGSYGWNEYLMFCGFEGLSESQIHSLLEYSMKCSVICGYHKMHDRSEKDNIPSVKLSYRAGKPGITYDHHQITDDRKSTKRTRDEMESMSRSNDYQDRESFGRFQQRQRYNER